jgi:hypothetical protein
MKILGVSALVILTWLLSPAPAAAQVDAANFGVQVGGGLTYLTVPEGVSRTMTLNAQGGVFAAFPIWRNIYFRPELVYERRKSEVDHKTYEVEYVGVPLLMHFEISGLYLAEGVAIKVPRLAKIDHVDVTNATKHDLGLVVVTGLRRGMLGAELRWDQGFRRWQKELQPGDIAVRNRSLTVHAVLSFGGGE